MFHKGIVNKQTGHIQRRKVWKVNFMAHKEFFEINLGNIAIMRQRKHVFFSRTTMDDPEKKPHSLVADFNDIIDLIPEIIEKYKK